MSAVEQAPLLTFVHGRFVPDVADASTKVRASLRYMETRPLGEWERPEDRRLFDLEREEIARRGAQEEILAARSPMVAFHRLILSPGPAQDAIDARDWTRMVLADLQFYLRQHLHWVGVVHRNTDHAHAHVLLGGGGERHGWLEPVVLRRDEYEFLRAAGDRHAVRALHVERAVARGLTQAVRYVSRQYGQRPRSFIMHCN